MKEEWKTKWLEALRSGEYKQGKEFLKKDGCYCCLGVLAEIVDPDYERDYKPNGITKLEALPQKIAAIVGTDIDPRVNYDGTEHFLSGLNDSDHSFEEIAYLIEEQL